MSDTDSRLNTDCGPRSLLERASDHYDADEFEMAIALYDQVLTDDDSSVNTYMVKELRAMAYCKFGRFEEAEHDLQELLSMIERKGGRPASSKVMYWLLVARHRGDENKAMSEFVSL